MSLEQNSVILSLTLSKVGNRKKVKRNTVNVVAREIDEQPEEIDQGMLHVSKDLLDSPELTAITEHLGKVRRYAKATSLPTNTLKSGMYRVASAEIPQIDAALEKFKEELIPLVNAFKSVYPQQVAASFERLGPLADPRDYPSEEQIASHFTIEYQYLVMEAPKKALGAISAEMVKREERKIQAQLENEVNKIELAFATSFQEIIDRMIERLKPSEDGKQKKLTEKGIEHLNEFFEMFNRRNVTGDAVLPELIAKAREIMNGRTVDEMNKDGDVRNFIAARMDQIKTTIDNLVISRGERRIVLIPNKLAEKGELSHAA